MHHNFVKHINICYKHLKNNINKTPLELNKRLSNKYGTNIYFKREDLQLTRSFKIRGSFNKINNLNNKKKLNKIICASAGNHAQGVAFSCNKLNIYGDIYVPSKTPLQKINRIKYYGKNKITIHLFGNNFDESLNKAKDVSKLENLPLIHPYDDNDIIDGQATICAEIYQDIIPDIIICPIGGGGLISGVSKYSKLFNKNTKIIGVEPNGADSMSKALSNNKPYKIENIDTFVDGASVSLVGNLNFPIVKKYVDDIYTISNEKLCHELIKCYQDDGIILEPAGCLSIAALDKVLDYNINNLDCNNRNLNIVCILSGGNNDLTRYDEIMDLNLKHLNLIHYFIVEFSQRPGELKLFINNILGPNDDIIRFEYIKKTNRNYGKVLIGIELTKKENLFNIMHNLELNNFKYNKIETNELI